MRKGRFFAHRALHPLGRLFRYLLTACSAAMTELLASETALTAAAVSGSVSIPIPILAAVLFAVAVGVFFMFKTR